MNAAFLAEISVGSLDLWRIFAQSWIVSRFWTDQMKALCAFFHGIIGGMALLTEGAVATIRFERERLGVECVAYEALRIVSFVARISLAV